MFKKLSFLLIIFLLVLIACGGAKVLRQTDNDAIIEAEGPTKAQAILKAEDKARELFGDFIETKEPNCSQNVKATQSAAKPITTTWICAIYVQRK